MGQLKGENSPVFARVTVSGILPNFSFRKFWYRWIENLILYLSVGIANHFFFVPKKLAIKKISPHIGSQLIRPEKVIVTSNWKIRDIWDDERTYLPLERRFKIIEYDGNGRIGPIEGVELPEPVRLDNSHLRPRPILVEKEKPICKICYYKPCQCMVDMVIDDSCKRSTPDHSDCDYSDDLLDM